MNKSVMMVLAIGLSACVPLTDRDWDAAEAECGEQLQSKGHLAVMADSLNTASTDQYGPAWYKQCVEKEMDKYEIVPGEGMMNYYEYTEEAEAERICDKKQAAGRAAVEQANTCTIDGKCNKQVHNPTRKPKYRYEQESANVWYNDCVEDEYAQRQAQRKKARQEAADSTIEQMILNKALSPTHTPTPTPSYAPVPHR